MSFKQLFSFLLMFGFSFGASLFFCSYNEKLDKVNILNDDIIVNLLSGLLALAIATITLIYTTIEKIRDKSPSSAHEGAIDSVIQRLFEALKKDTWTIFSFLIIVIFIILIRDTDVPYVKWQFSFSKITFVFFCKLLIEFLCFFAIADIVLTLFALISNLNTVKRKSDKYRLENK
jgi:hypothetical protein